MNSAMAQAGAVFIARDEALEHLDAALGRALEGRSVACVITGEPGIGKTTLLAAAIGRARARGFRVLHGRAREYDGSIPYATLGDAVSHFDTDELPAAARDLLAELRTALENVAVGGVSPPDANIVALATHLLRLLTDRGPCLISIDDSHLGDDESLTALTLALRYLSDRPVVVFATVRKAQWSVGGAFASTLGRIAQEDADGVVDIGAFDRQEIAAFVGETINGVPDAALVDVVFTRSHGNPLFARESLLSLGAQGALRRVEGRVYLAGEPTTSVVSHRGALLQRIFQQDGDALRLARVLSAFRRVDLHEIDLLAELTDLSAPQLQKAFDALCSSAILTPVSDDSFEFTHPMISEVLYEDIGPLERRRLHASIAAYFAAHPSIRVGLLERATHVLGAASPGDAYAGAIALQASAATRDTAPLASARWLGRALELAEPDSSEAAMLLARQTNVYWKAGRPELAVDAGIRAAALLPDNDRREATSISVVNALQAMGRVSDALTQSELLMPGTVSAAAVAQRSLLFAQLGRHVEAEESRAIAWALVVDAAPESQAVAFSNLALVENAIGVDVDLHRALDHLWTLANDETLPSKSARMSALETWMLVRELSDQPGTERDRSPLLRDLPAAVGWRDLGGQFSSGVARRNAEGGRWEDALAAIRAAAVPLEFAGVANNLARMRLLEAEILFHQDRAAEARVVLDAVKAPESYAEWAAALDITRAADPDAREPGAMLTQVIERALAGGWNEQLLRGIDALVDVALARGDSSALRTAEPLIRSAIPRASLVRRLARPIASAAALLDGKPAAIESLLATEQFSAFHTARTHYLLASLGREPELHLATAVDGFAALHADAWLARCRTLAKRRGIRPMGALRQSRESAAGVLSDTERELVRLLRDGLNNREIADLLHYSRKTVEAYLSRLYRKTGSTSRVGLVVAAERQGWLERQPSNH